MAATNFTPIQLYRTATASATPSAGNLADGELAINTNDGKLFYKDSGGSVQVIGTKGGVGSSSTTQVLYNSGGLVTGSSGLVFDASGNLGLGVTPSAWISSWKAIDFVGPAVISGGVNGAYVMANAYFNNSSQFIYKSTSQASYYQQTAGSHNWYTAPSGTAGNAITFTQAMTLDSSGNLLVGATGTNLAASGRKEFVIQGGVSGSYVEFNSSSGFDAYLGATSAGTTLATVGATPLIFATSSTERARIDASGNLLVGQTTHGFVNANSFEASPANGGYTIANHISGSASGTAYAYFAYNTAAIGSITQSGTTAVLYNTTSDQRLKENIQDAEPASALIDSIQVRSFDWKADGSHQRYGMVAQELYQVAPEAVHAPADPDDMMAVDYSKLVPMLVKEIQSLRARVAQLESKA